MTSLDLTKVYNLEYSEDTLDECYAFLRYTLTNLAIKEVSWEMKLGNSKTFNLIDSFRNKLTKGDRFSIDLITQIDANLPNELCKVNQDYCKLFEHSKSEVIPPFTVQDLKYVQCPSYRLICKKGNDIVKIFYNMSEQQAKEFESLYKLEYKTYLLIKNN